MLPKPVLATTPRNFSCDVTQLAAIYTTALYKCSEQQPSLSVITGFSLLGIALSAKRIYRAAWESEQTLLYAPLLVHRA
jgi:hypothetical protein